MKSKYIHASAQSEEEKARLKKINELTNKIYEFIVDEIKKDEQLTKNFFQAYYNIMIFLNATFIQRIHILENIPLIQILPTFMENIEYVTEDGIKKMKKLNL